MIATTTNKPGGLQLRMRFEVEKTANGWRANGYLNAAGDRDCFLSTEVGDSPAAAVEAAENEARKVLEAFVAKHEGGGQ